MRYLIVLYLSVVSTFAKNLPQPNGVKIDRDTNWRIIGGENAPDGEYPHIVSIKYTDNPSNRHLCGGSIVHEEWIITAAQCLTLSDPKDYIVVAGSNKLSKGGDIYKVYEIHKHELYDDDTWQNDIAILKVEKIKFTDKVNKIKLEKTFVGGDISVTISGWGAIRPGGPPAENLQHLTYNTITVEECRERMGGELPIEDTQICTLHTAAGGCYGDSGSPLMRSVDGVRYVVGTVSYGPVCGSDNYPDIFQRVSSHVSWFNKKCNCDL